MNLKLIDQLNNAMHGCTLKSFSQAGEDRILDMLFSMTGVKNISYIDVGASHPFSGSNTYLFYQKGFSGVCVEPNAQFIEQYKLARPDDIYLDYAVSAESGVLNYYMFEEKYNSMNTFSKEQADYWSKRGFKCVNVKEVKMVPLNAIIDIYLKKVPSFISMDVEGLELDILEAFDFEKYSVPCFCIETLRYHENTVYTDKKIIDFMKMKNYIYYAETGINSIFIKKELLDKWNIPSN